jgi:RES domain-containing protein
MTDAPRDRRVSDTRPPLEVPGIAVSLRAWCTGPDAPALDVADLATTDPNRWSRPGEPTIYLAGDPGVALAELGRHWEEQEGNIALWSADLSLAAAADLRHARFRATLGLPSNPTWLLDAERCRMVAARLRSEGRHDGLIVPSVAFMDAGSRWNAVVFVECHPADLADVVRVRAQDLLVTRSPTGVGE